MGAQQPKRAIVAGLLRVGKRMLGLDARQNLVHVDVGQLVAQDQRLGNRDHGFLIQLEQLLDIPELLGQDRLDPRLDIWPGDALHAKGQVRVEAIIHAIRTDHVGGRAGSAGKIGRDAVHLDVQEQLLGGPAGD